MNPKVHQRHRRQFGFRPADATIVPTCNPDASKIWKFRGKYVLDLARRARSMCCSETDAEKKAGVPQIEVTPELIGFLSAPNELLVERVEAVISSWLSRNWSEVRDGAYPEMCELTRQLQCVLCS